MPLENATYIDTLVPDWPTGPSDPVNIGDDNLRMIKKVLQNTFPGTNAPITGTPEQINNITLNTPWIDNSATAGALSNFNLTDPKKADGTLAAVAVATPTIAQANANTNLAMSIALFFQIQYPAGAEFRSYTDSRNPADILGFGTWEAVTGLIAGVGAATDSQGYIQNYSAGYQAGYWRVQNSQIVASTLSLTMEALPPHQHDYDFIQNSGSGMQIDATYDAFQKIEQQTSSVSAGTPVGTVTIGAGTATDSTAFFNPYYGCYIWKRTA
ncbi:phage baseplate protein [Citrobacter sp. Marseille-Q6884]|uniref:phage baseplate protein n=1 Tax=Citrobacter sp. Marseille-Q6884 TaxID=2956786 RepID=UPI0021B31D0E|nr:hypothetical protein [Citrobacter sp. Marseille-Q6884]